MEENGNSNFIDEIPDKHCNHILALFLMAHRRQLRISMAFWTICYFFIASHLTVLWLTGELKLILDLATPEEYKAEFSYVVFISEISLIVKYAVTILRNNRALFCPFLLVTFLTPSVSLQQTPLNRFWRLIAHTTCLRNRWCLLGGHDDNWPLSGGRTPEKKPKLRSE